MMSYAQNNPGLNIFENMKGTCIIEILVVLSLRLVS